jgi:hypothetical protein
VCCSKPGHTEGFLISRTLTNEVSFSLIVRIQNASILFVEIPAGSKLPPQLAHKTVETKQAGTKNHSVWPNRSAPVVNSAIANAESTPKCPINDDCCNRCLMGVQPRTRER